MAAVYRTVSRVAAFPKFAVCFEESLTMQSCLQQNALRCTVSYSCPLRIQNRDTAQKHGTIFIGTLFSERALGKKP